MVICSVYATVDMFENFWIHYKMLRNQNDSEGLCNNVVLIGRGNADILPGVVMNQTYGILVDLLFI